MLNSLLNNALFIHVVCSAGMQPVEVISDGLVQNPLKLYCVVKPDVQTSSF